MPRTGMEIRCLPSLPISSPLVRNLRRSSRIRPLDDLAEALVIFFDLENHSGLIFPPYCRPHSNFRTTGIPRVLWSQRGVHRGWTGWGREDRSQETEDRSGILCSIFHPPSSILSIPVQSGIFTAPKYSARAKRWPKGALRGLRPKT